MLWRLIDCLSCIKNFAAIRLGISKRLGICILKEHVSDTFEMLTSREQEVFLGRTNKEIGEMLGISIYTVEAHRALFWLVWQDGR